MSSNDHGDYESDYMQGRADAAEGRWSPPGSNTQRFFTDKEGGREYDKRAAAYREGHADKLNEMKKR